MSLSLAYGIMTVEWWAWVSYCFWNDECKLGLWNDEWEWAMVMENLLELWNDECVLWWV